MAVTTKKTFPATTNATTTVFSPVGIQLNNQDDLDVYVTLSGGTRVLQLRQSTGSTAQSSHPQVNNTDGLYFPAVTAGTTLYNYTLSTDNNTITFNSALPSGAVVSCERRTRDADGSYTTFASGSTIRATDLNNSSTESNFTAQDGRNKAFDLEGKLFDGPADGSIKTKLDGIEANATQDQTASEIRALVESASDSNVFTDADHSKLNAIEAGATADQTASEIRSLVESASDSNVFTDADHSKLDNIEASATADQTAAEIRALVESASDSNVFTDADHNKLDNIEANATADQTNAEIRAAVEAASDSNVFTDADHTKLNGISAGADVTSTNSINALTDVNTSGVADGKILKYQASSSSFVIADDTGGGGGSSAFTGLSDTPLNFTGAANKLLIVNSNSNAIEFVNTLAGDITFADDIKVKFGAGNDLEIYHNSSDEFSYIRETNATGSLRIQGEQLIFEDLAGDNYIYCLHDAEVRLYYDNAAKLYTTSYGIEVRGDGNTGDGTLQLNCSQNSHGIKLKSPPHSAAQSYTLTFPSSILANGFLKTDANGNLSFAAVDTDLVNDTSPQLGGNLDMQSNNITGTGTITANSVASNANGMRKITTSTSDPTSSDGADGDVWFTYAS